MKSNPLSKQLLGKRGEELAAKHLKEKGYQILGRNFKARYGELDIIAREANILVFVEVKTRIGVAFGIPEEAVTPWKIREVVKTAEYYKLLHPELPESLRIDVIGILMDDAGRVVSLNHTQNITG